MLVPALLTHTSIPPKADTAASANSRTWSGSVTSVGTASAELLAPLHGPIEQRAAPGGEDHVGAARGESPGHSELYAARSPGDHHRGVAQTIHDPCSSLRPSAD